MKASPTRKLLLGTIAGLAVMAAALAPASAKGKHHGHHRVFLPIIVTGQSNCSFYYWKWQNTGSLFWKRRYASCIY